MSGCMIFLNVRDAIFRRCGMVYLGIEGGFLWVMVLRGLDRLLLRSGRGRGFRGRDRLRGTNGRGCIEVMCGGLCVEFWERRGGLIGKGRRGGLRQVGGMW